MSRAPTLQARLARLGVHDAARAESLLAALGCAPEVLLDGLGGCADPDLALLALARLRESVLNHDGAAPVDHDGAAPVALLPCLEELLGSGGEPLERLLKVVGASEALGTWLVAHPTELVGLTRPTPGTNVLAEPPDAARAELMRALADAPEATGAPARDALRRAYRRRLARIAAADLTARDALEILPAVAAALADLAAAALEVALEIARAEVPGSADVRLAVVGMGKTGGRELNYVSDVDVIYVAEPASADVDEDEALRVATRLAARLAQVCSAPGGEPALWEVDAALRPEGAQGPLVRTLASHRAYYERWAKTWEFQALLKARPVAGDAELGEAYVAMTHPMVWTAVQRENFVADSQAMRRRVVDHIPPREAERQLKLGRGGLRDVEFTVQLLQLVHGRVSPSVQRRGTLEALEALAAEGLVARNDAARLGECYRFLRLLEHRLQLRALRRTHLMPESQRDLERLARAVGLTPAPGTTGAEELQRLWRSVRRDVRGLHEALFYRPLLPAVAQLSQEEAALTPEAARARLAALGYRAPDAALGHIAALTDGLTRRAAIQRYLLPALIGWFALGPDPDGGLLAFRRLSEEVGGHHWYLQLLRDSRVAAKDLARVLSSSRYAADALRRLPESVRWLAEDGDLRPRTPQALEREIDALLRRREVTEAAEAAMLLRHVRRRELARTAVSDVLSHLAEPLTPAISYAADAALTGALRIATAVVCAEQGLAQAPTALLVVAMGRLGGHELSYASDADVMFVHDPRAGASQALAQRFALAVAQRVGSLLGATGPEPPLVVDASLRPEGRNGPLTRTIAAYEEYYARWSSPWERQALLRARVVAGDTDLAGRFLALVDPVRYGAGLTPSELREVRRLKARMETERLPRGVPSTHHIKLGRGGLSDVEWTAQLLQLCHAGELAALRTPRTPDAIAAAAQAGLLTDDDAARLTGAWSLGVRVRDAVVLLTGRVSGPKVDVLPMDRRELAGVAQLLGYGPGAGGALEEDYLRAARRARRVVERVFYGE